MADWLQINKAPSHHSVSVDWTALCHIAILFSPRELLLPAATKSPSNSLSLVNVQFRSFAYRAQQLLVALYLAYCAVRAIWPNAANQFASNMRQWHAVGSSLVHADDASGCVEPQLPPPHQNNHRAPARHATAAASRTRAVFSALFETTPRFFSAGQPTSFFRHRYYLGQIKCAHPPTCIRHRCIDLRCNLPARYRATAPCSTIAQLVSVATLSPWSPSRNLGLGFLSS